MVHRGEQRGVRADQGGVLLRQQWAAGPESLLDPLVREIHGPCPLLRRGPEPDLLLGEPIRRFQSGVVNDYVTWIVVGVACVGGALAFTIG